MSRWGLADDGSLAYRTTGPCTACGDHIPAHDLEDHNDEGTDQ